MRITFFPHSIADGVPLLRSLFYTAAVAVLVASTPVHAQSPDDRGDQLMVGVAQVNLSPPADAALLMSGYGDRPEGFEGINDDLYTKVIVLQSGDDKAAIVVNDLIATSNALRDTISRRAEERFGIPQDMVLIAATHTHGGPAYYDTGEPNPKRTAYRESMEDRIVQALDEANASLQPAQMGVGTGSANINVNRVADRLESGWSIGRNPDGVSDKTVHVVKFESLDGTPLAVLVNYAVHAVVMGPDNLQITADVPGATSNYVQEQLGGDVIVPWTSGAAGDQNPIYGPGEQFGDPIQFGGRIHSIENLGQILGQEVVEVANNIDASDRYVRIRGAQKDVSIAGKKRGSYELDSPSPYTPADSVDLRLSLLMLDYLALTGVAGEVLTGISLRLKEESPVAHTIMLTHANGSVGYIPSDKAYDRPSYEVISGSAMMSGAEDAVVNGLLDLIEKTK